MPNRREFVLRGTASGTLLAGSGITFARRWGGRQECSSVQEAGSEQEAPAPETPKQETAEERPPRLDLDLVREMVGKSHGDLQRVKELVAGEPRLVNACHDWTAGDFETALGAASHVGNREIALFLLEEGARMDIFAAAMLGEIEIVRAFLTAQPYLIDTPGPHGIPLIKHAEYGGDGRIVRRLRRFVSGFRG